MSETLDYLIAQAYQIPAGQVLTVDDDLGVGRAVAVTAGYYRTFAAQTTLGTGTESNPYELLYRLRQDLTPAQWLLELLADGRVEVTYNGVAPGGLIVAHPLFSLLGFNPAVSIGPLAPGAKQIGGFLPTHAIFFGAAEDTGWTRHQGRFSGARMPSGVVYGWGDRLSGLTRKVVCRLLPKDQTTRAALIVASPTSGPPTACYGPETRTINPEAGEPLQEPPWGAAETAATAGARSLGLMLGTLQAAIAAPAGAPFERAYLSPETVATGGAIRLSVEGYDPRRDLADIELAYVASETRS